MPNRLASSTCCVRLCPRMMRPSLAATSTHDRIGRAEVFLNADQVQAIGRGVDIQAAVSTYTPLLSPRAIPVQMPSPLSSRKISKW